GKACEILVLAVGLMAAADAHFALDIGQRGLPAGPLVGDADLHVADLDPLLQRKRRARAAEFGAHAGAPTQGFVLGGGKEIPFRLGRRLIARQFAEAAAEPQLRAAAVALDIAMGVEAEPAALGERD